MLTEHCQFKRYFHMIVESPKDPLRHVGRSRVNQTKTSAHQTEACRSVMGLKETEEILPGLWPQTHRQSWRPVHCRPWEQIASITAILTYRNPPWHRLHPCARKGFGKQHVAPEHWRPTLSYTNLFSVWTEGCLQSSIPQHAQTFLRSNFCP